MTDPNFQKMPSAYKEQFRKMVELEKKKRLKEKKDKQKNKKTIAERLFGENK